MAVANCFVGADRHLGFRVEPTALIAVTETHQTHHQEIQARKESRSQLPTSLHRSIEFGCVGVQIESRPFVVLVD